MIERDFRDTEGAVAVGFSQGHFSLVVEALDDAAGEGLPGTEVVQDQRAVRAERPDHLLHRFDARAHDLAAPLIEELARPGRRVVVPELLDRKSTRLNSSHVEIS